MKILASHNTLTSSRPLHWWDWFLLPFARCQSKSIREQYEAGARLFDIRVRVTDEGDVYVSHGLCDFKADAYDTLFRLNHYARRDNEKVYIRIVNEDTFKDTSWSDFMQYVHMVRSSFKNLSFEVIPSKKDWCTDSRDKDYPIDIQHTCYWQKGFPFLPRLYSLIHNDEHQERMNCDTHGIWWFDFI